MIKLIIRYVQSIKRKKALKVYMAWKNSKILPLP